MRFGVWLTTNAPLAISRHRASGNQLETVQHIPGTSWRGSLAASMIGERRLKDEAHRDPDFSSLFLSGRVRFGDLRTSGAVPFPLSSRACATYSDHRITDLLLYRQFGQEFPRACDAPTVDGPCQSKTEALSGTYRMENSRPVKYGPQQRVLAHTAISNESLRIREGQFHSSTVIERKTRFRGDAWCQDDEASAIFQRLCHETPQIALGRGITRGQGLATLEIEPLPALGIEELEQKLTAFNAPFEATGKLAFTVTLNSPCVVYDQWNFCRSYINNVDLTQACSGFPGADFSAYILADWFSRLVTIEGWNAQAGLPKSALSAIAPGSAFLFLAEVPRHQYQAEISRLAGLLAQCAAGIGERWEEGFGEARFCDPIHNWSRP